MMANNDIHVVPAGEGWAVEAQNSGKRTMFATQEEAIQAGDSKIRARNSFGHDSRDIKG